MSQWCSHLIVVLVYIILSCEYIISVYQSNNNFIFIQFLHVFDVFSSG